MLKKKKNMLVFKFEAVTQKKREKIGSLAQRGLYELKIE